MTMRKIRGVMPTIHSSAYISETAEIIGQVEIGSESSVWFGSVIRGDVDRITIGQRTNVQDLSIIHVRHDGFPTLVGDDVTLGHRVTLHGCVLKDRVLVGIGAIVLDGVTIESDSMIAAGSLVTPGTHVPSGVLMMGSPARVKRDLTLKEKASILESADSYVRYQELYRG